MSALPEDAETYPRYCMLDHERDAEEALAALGFRPHVPLTDDELTKKQLAVLAAAYARRAAEDAAVAAASRRYSLTTALGRLAAERVADAQRAQLDATKEIT
jgi:hypothetical protein